jgi:hypothetical protein
MIVRCYLIAMDEKLIESITKHKELYGMLETSKHFHINTHSVSITMLKSLCFLGEFS